MGKGKQDGKASDKGSGGKAGKGKEKEKEKDSKPKGAMSINVRHILVRLPAHKLQARRTARDDLTPHLKCEKHSKKEEALAKLREGVKFDEVAREFSEDKARQGERETTRSYRCALWTILNPRLLL